MRDTRTNNPARSQTEAQEEGGAVREHTERTHPDPRAGKNHTVKFTTDDGRIIIRSCCFDPHRFASPSDQIIHEHRRATQPRRDAPYKAVNVPRKLHDAVFVLVPVHSASITWPYA